MGFEFGQGKRSQHLKEKDDVILARQQYLRLMKSNRGKDDQPVRNEIYLDESYVTENSPKFHRPPPSAVHIASCCA